MGKTTMPPAMKGAKMPKMGVPKMPQMGPQKGLPAAHGSMNTAVDHAPGGLKTAATAVSMQGPAGNQGGPFGS